MGDGTELPEEGLDLRRSTRARQALVRYFPQEYVMITNAREPECYDKAMQSVQSQQWHVAMQEDIDSLQKNHTCVLEQKSKGKKVFRSKWVFKIKSDDTCSQPKYKARLIVKGFEQ